jgi:hypothetical protein
MPPVMPIPEQYDPYKQQQMLANMLKQPSQPARPAREPQPAPMPVGGGPMPKHDFMSELKTESPQPQTNPLESAINGFSRGLDIKKQMDAFNSAGASAPAASSVPDLGVRGWLEHLFGPGA